MARFRRPAMLSAEMAESIVGGADPATRSEAAHATAAALVRRGRAESADGALLQRLIGIVETEGLDTLASLWADSPAGTLPGALWRMYLLREWTRRNPELVSRHCRLGMEVAEVSGAIAGAAALPGPDEMRDLADAILRGAYRGDFAVALERAGAFARVLAAGSAIDADTVTDEEAGTALTRNGSRLQEMADELTDEAQAWRAGRLD